MTKPPKWVQLSKMPNIETKEMHQPCWWFEIKNWGALVKIWVHSETAWWYSEKQL